MFIYLFLFIYLLFCLFVFYLIFLIQNIIEMFTYLFFFYFLFLFSFWTVMNWCIYYQMKQTFIIWQNSYQNEIVNFKVTYT